ncbi:hypothetical protein HanRHA438_Chr04g0190051 [Helianthus annuus]|nr:hypothetical protein HanRHA438_Chr04g0190051 [Helianthus annuus]
MGLQKASEQATEFVWFIYQVQEDEERMAVNENNKNKCGLTRRARANASK